MPALEPLLAWVRREYFEVYDADRSAGTADDLTETKLDLILAGGTAVDAAGEPALLAQLTTAVLNLAANHVPGANPPGEPICEAGVVDVSGVPGASDVFGEPRPTMATVVANVIGVWTGQLTANGADWAFTYDPASLEIAVEVLTGMNEGRLIVSSGC
jgi:hypothetical protein